MATTNQIKFYKVQTLPATLVVGAVYFEVTTQRICVAKTTTEYDAFGVGLKSATLNDGILTITRFDNTAVTVDLNDIASATSVQNALNAINYKINVINGTGDGSIKKAVADEKSAREAAEAQIRADFAAADTAAAQAAATEYAAIRGEFAAADATLQTNIDKKADAATTYSKTEVDGLVNVKADAADVYTKTETDAAIKVVSDALAQEVTDRTNAVSGLQDQIDALEAASVTVKAADGDKYVAVAKAADSYAYTVSSKGIDDAISTAVSAEKSEREAAEAGLQGAIDVEKGRIDTLIGDVEGDDALSAREIVQDEVAKQLTSENISESFDTLKEMAEWLSAHPEDVQEMNSAISKNATDIANEAAARAAADTAHASAIEALEQADAAQDTLIAGKADQTDLDETNDAVALNTEAVADHKTRIEALEATSGALGTTYVKVSDYNTDKAAFVQKHTDLQGEIDAAEGRLDLVEGDITTIKGEQTTQNAAIEAADAKGAQGINDAADALAEAQAKVASVTGDADVNASTVDHAVSLSLNKATAVAQGDTKAVTSGAVYDALCWVEFE